METNLVLEDVWKSSAWVRLESQISWYEARSRKNKRIHKTMQFFQLTMAILIPAIVHIELPITKWIISALGALIATLEGLQYLNQYEALWVSYEEITGRLKREKYLFLSSAGPYKELSESERLIQLAERIEKVISV